MKENRRLRMLRRLERFSRTLEHEAAQGNLEPIFGRRQELTRRLVLLDQVARHTHKLGALAGKEERERAYSVLMTSRPS